MKKADLNPIWKWQDEVCNFLQAWKYLGFWFTLLYKLGLAKDGKDFVTLEEEEE